MVLPLPDGETLYVYASVEWPDEVTNGPYLVSGVDRLFSTIVPLPDREDAEAIVVSGQQLDRIQGLPGKVYQSIIPGLQTHDTQSHSFSSPLIIYPHGTQTVKITSPF